MRRVLALSVVKINYKIFVNFVGRHKMKHGRLNYYYFFRNAFKAVEQYSVSQMNDEIYFGAWYFKSLLRRDIIIVFLYLT